MKPIIIILALVPFVLTAYAEAPSHVDVYDYPFNITLLEGGNFTLYNTNGTANINMVSHGWFDAVAPAGGSVTVELPADKFFADTYYVQDVMNDSMSTITIEKPTPVYVPPTQPTQPTQPIQPIPEVTGDHTWCNSPCSDDVGIIFNSTSNGTSETFEPITTQPNVSNNTIAELKAKIQSLKTERYY